MPPTAPKDESRISSASNMLHSSMDASISMDDVSSHGGIDMDSCDGHGASVAADSRREIPPSIADRLSPAGVRADIGDGERPTPDPESGFAGGGEGCDGGPWDPPSARLALRSASSELRRRGMGKAALWAGEQLVGLAVAPPPPSSLDDPAGAGTPPRKPPAIAGEIMRGGDWCGRDDDLDDATLHAKSLFDAGEYGRAAEALSVAASEAAPTLPAKGRRRLLATGGVASSDPSIHPPSPHLDAFGICLRAYALYLAGERRKEEEIVELCDPLERMSVRNAYLTQLSAELYDYFSAGSLDPFGMYVYGVVLKESNKSPTGTSTAATKFHSSDGMHTPTAHGVFIESLLAFPYNWSAWLDLSQLCIDDPSIHPDVEDSLRPISAHWMYHFFCVHVFLENQANDNAIAVIERLIHGNSEDMPDRAMFVRSPYLQSQLAVAHYNMRDFDSAQSLFSALAERDPNRLDSMDVYSNILYVKEDRVALSQLAHRAVRIDKYRPETCCIVGNYYSLRGRHERAVVYFQRALKLDRTYLAAWTLMGHEYVEMKNAAAAVEAYRRAVDINPRDYRAWYGLGQTYEIMNMLLYALFYYRRAAALRPYDARMWCAVGGCYLGLDRRADAVRTYERAVSSGDGEGIATRRLAGLYREDGDAEGAARCYLRHLELRYQAQRAPSSPDSRLGTPGGLEGSIDDVINQVRVDAPEAEALLYLAYYYRDNGEYETAGMCCSRLLEYPGPEKEEGKALLREIRSRMDRRGGRVGRGNAGSGQRQQTVESPQGEAKLMGESMETSRMDGQGSSFEFSP